MKVPLLVVKGEGPSLFGRDWLTKIRLDWGAINTVKCRTLTSVLESYSSVFEPGLGTLQGYEAKIYVDPGAQPKYCKARSVPYAMRGKVEEELERLMSEGIVKPVQFADWNSRIHWPAVCCSRVSRVLSIERNSSHSSCTASAFLEQIG